MDIKAAIKSQYHSALTTLANVIEPCTDELWLAREHHPGPYWQVAYHAVFFTHLYLVQSEAHFSPHPMHRNGQQFLIGDVPPDGPEPDLNAPYRKQKVMEYLRWVEGQVDQTVDSLDLDADDCGFWWYGDMPKLDHVILNIRHAQHHAAQLADRLERETGKSTDWISRPT